AGYFAFSAFTTGVGRSVVLMVVSVSFQLPSNPKLADTAVLSSLNSASYSFEFSLSHLTSVAPGNFALNAFKTASGAFTFCAQVVVAKIIHNMDVTTIAFIFIEFIF